MLTRNDEYIEIRYRSENGEERTVRVEYQPTYTVGEMVDAHDEKYATCIRAIIQGSAMDILDRILQVDRHVCRYIATDGTWEYRNHSVEQAMYNLVVAWNELSPEEKRCEITQNNFEIFEVDEDDEFVRVLMSIRSVLMKREEYAELLTYFVIPLKEFTVGRMKVSLGYIDRNFDSAQFFVRSIDEGLTIAVDEMTLEEACKLCKDIIERGDTSQVMNMKYKGKTLSTQFEHLF